MLRILFIIILVIQLYSCKESKIENITSNDTALNISEKITNTNKIEVTENVYTDTIRIDKNVHRKILNLLTLIPDNSRGSWDWKTEDRLQMVNDALKDGYIIDTDPQYMNIKCIQPNYFQIQVVDGNWVMALFKIDENNNIIITDDIVGDGNDIHAYKINNSKITELKVDEIIPDIKSSFIKHSDKSNCVSLLEPEFELTFDYDFSQKDKLIIRSPYKKDGEDSDCLNGNTLVLQFDKNSRRLQFTSMDWKSVRIEE